MFKKIFYSLTILAMLVGMFGVMDRVVHRESAVRY